MFTGIIEALGTIESMVDQGESIRLKVGVGKLDMSDVALGDSIATNGVCLTVVDYSPHHYSADVSAETIRLTGFAQYKPGTQVNLEKAMQVSSRFGGHIVSGHVDGVGEVSRIIQHSDYVEIWIDAPDDLAKYIAHKGSITVDGVSLTVNKVNGSEFMLWIIPHTLQETVLHRAAAAGRHDNVALPPSAASARRSHGASGRCTAAGSGPARRHGWIAAPRTTCTIR